ncbi:iron-sulfur cluster assembly protein [Jiangella alkaliphila]|uniref:iron-sulfur cluster assembly protein n=1 Tax=Jiangella alkaliphila TaxID=419479 RepID=UPI000629502E
MAAGPEPAVWRALDTVVDPELDEPVTELGFVSAVSVEDGVAHIRLRLPTYFCAPNFAYLMVADAYEAARAVPGVDAVDVRLEDHFAADEINGGVAVGDGFAAAFEGQVGPGETDRREGAGGPFESSVQGADQQNGPGQHRPDPPSNVMADGELQELRVTFWRKAHAAEQERVASRLASAGTDLAAARLGDAGDVTRLRRRRSRLGLPDGDDAPLLVDDEGAPIPADALPLRLRLARTTRISIEGNAGFCRGLLSTRYGR